jgi:hypothetical protein
MSGAEIVDEDECPYRLSSLVKGNPVAHVMPQLKKQKRVGRFFWKNLEAKPLNFELASLRFIKSR